MNVYQLIIEVNDRTLVSETVANWYIENNSSAKIFKTMKYVYKR